MTFLRRVTAQPIGILDGIDFQFTGVVRKVDATAIARHLEAGGPRARLPPGGLVYSTDGGGMSPPCRLSVAQCKCKAAPARPAGDGVVRVSRETKGRAGKGVTLVRGVPLDAAALTVLGKQLKALCGSGGTVKEGTIEVQGDHCERVMEALKAQGYTVKRAGG